MTHSRSRADRRRCVSVDGRHRAFQPDLCASKLIVRGDAAATAGNILAHETMFAFRFSLILSDR